jgi:phosphoribosylaminoimidazolecarboxamide formyltransferase/IMP cyclohydrolase
MMTVRLDNLETLDVRPIRRALISVSDKTRLAELARALTDAGVRIVSTGSTAQTIAGQGIPVTPVEEVTGFPEVLEGRVKTLHPAIHAGLLADQRKADHREQLERLGIEAFDLVVCNLYPFADTVASGAGFDACVEQIDIGGPSMVRAAAKNHPSVAVVTSPGRYDEVVQAVRGGGFTLAQRRALAAEAFAHTAAYDLAIATWFAGRTEPGGERDGGEDGAFPRFAGAAFERVAALRYGENPHQSAAVYREAGAAPAPSTSPHAPAAPAPGIANARQLHGKAMSYNNYTDGDAALRAAFDHDEPCVAIIKHANPCGIAIAATVEEAHRKAHACDPVSAYGGVIAVNRPVTPALARQIVPIFTEVVLAPSYEDGALEVLSAKKNLRVLEVTPPQRAGTDFRQISGGLLVQDRDALDAAGDDPAAWELVSGGAADAATLADLAFAWRTVRAVRSNAILLVKDGASVGVGMGQVNRVDSCRLAVERANTLGARESGDAATPVDSAGGARAEDVLAQAPEQRARGAVAASDAFFPFADGLQVLIDAGVKAVVQPGGSIRDEESIAAARAAGVTMYLTRTRHFAH